MTPEPITAGAVEPRVVEISVDVNPVAIAEPRIRVGSANVAFLVVVPARVVAVGMRLAACVLSTSMSTTTEEDRGRKNEEHLPHGSSLRLLPVRAKNLMPDGKPEILALFRRDVVRRCVRMISSQIQTNPNGPFFRGRPTFENPRKSRGLVLGRLDFVDFCVVGTPGFEPAPASPSLPHIQQILPLLARGHDRTVGAIENADRGCGDEDQSNR